MGAMRAFLTFGIGPLMAQALVLGGQSVGGAAS